MQNKTRDYASLSFSYFVPYYHTTVLPYYHTTILYSHLARVAPRYCYETLLWTLSLSDCRLVLLAMVVYSSSMNDEPERVNFVPRCLERMVHYLKDILIATYVTNKESADPYSTCDFTPLSSF